MKNKFKKEETCNKRKLFIQHDMKKFIILMLLNLITLSFLWFLLIWFLIMYLT